MTDRLKQIVEKYTLKETDGFEGKKDKETNVEEDLRKNYETGKMVPYQSVIAEGKIIVNKKKTLKEASQSLEELKKKALNDMIEDMESEGYTPKKGKTESLMKIAELSVWEFISGELPEEVMTIFCENAESEGLASEDGEDEE